MKKLKYIKIITVFVLTIVFANNAFAEDPFCTVTLNNDWMGSVYSLRTIVEGSLNQATNNVSDCSITGTSLENDYYGKISDLVYFQTSETGTSQTPVSRINIDYKYEGTVIPIIFDIPTKRTALLGNPSNEAITSMTNLYDPEQGWIMDGNEFKDLGYVMIDGTQVLSGTPLQCNNGSGSVYLSNLVIFSNGYTYDDFVGNSQTEETSCFVDGGDLHFCSGAPLKEHGEFDPNTTDFETWCDCAKVTIYPDTDGDGYGDGAADSSGSNVGPGKFGVFDGSKLNSGFYGQNKTVGIGTKMPTSLSLDTSKVSYNLTKEIKKVETQFLKPTIVLEAKDVCVELLDQYGEGYTQEGGDCDDNDPYIYPGAEERCNGLDDDCDGQIDEGLDDCYLDSDDDGFTEETDCDDNDPNVNPGAAEVCDDDIDNDCDGLIDCADDDCDGANECTDPNAYVDEDGDGYTNDVDCDDNDNTVYPGAEELCDEIDNDCNGIVDDNEDCYEKDDLDGDGFTKDDGDCDDYDDTVYPGAFDVCDDTIDQDCDGIDRECEYEVCDDGVDNDEDGLIDCEDEDCDSYYTCNGYGQEEVCDDGIDNEDDGYTDCEDADCMFDSACTGETETECDDGIDNDNDGYIDGDDIDCAEGQVTPIDDDVQIQGGAATGGCSCDLTATSANATNSMAMLAMLGLALLVSLFRVRVGFSKEK